MVQDMEMILADGGDGGAGDAGRGSAVGGGGGGGAAIVVGSAGGVSSPGGGINESLLNANRKTNPVRLQIVPSQPKTLSHLPTRPAVDLAFHDLTYSVREGRRSSEYFTVHFYLHYYTIFVREWLHIIVVQHGCCTTRCSWPDAIANRQREMRHHRVLIKTPIRDELETSVQWDGTLLIPMSMFG